MQNVSALLIRPMGRSLLGSSGILNHRMLESSVLRRSTILPASRTIFRPTTSHSRVLRDLKPSHGPTRSLSDIKNPNSNRPSHPVSDAPLPGVTDTRAHAIAEKPPEQQSTKKLTEEDTNASALSSEGAPTQETASKPPNPTARLDTETSNTLPSQHIFQRSTVAARFNSKMERMLNALALLSHRVNIYTGTDYSSISALRSSINEQEVRVSELLEEVATAKQTHTAAITAQATSNKEVVRLLERKNTWSDTDLERYMGLVRSEHVNEQAVQTSKDAITTAERDLEDARAELEKTERRQYHEEQVWSDTIRRNSTWVTFGLMGFNIILLLASLVIIEPWRRKRLVKEVRSALAEKQASSQTASDTDAVASIDQLKDFPAEVTPDKAALASSQTMEDEQSNADLPIPAAPAAVVPHDQPPTTVEARPPLTLYADTWTGTFALWKAYWSDLFSERVIALRRVDLTAAALEGAAAGAAFMGLMLVLLRPR